MKFKLDTVKLAVTVSLDQQQIETFQKIVEDLDKKMQKHLDKRIEKLRKELTKS